MQTHHSVPYQKVCLSHDSVSHTLSKNEKGFRFIISYLDKTPILIEHKPQTRHKKTQSPKPECSKVSVAKFKEKKSEVTLWLPRKEHESLMRDTSQCLFRSVSVLYYLVFSRSFAGSNTDVAQIVLLIAFRFNENTFAIQSVMHLTN